MAVSDWVYDSKKGAYVRDFSTAAKGVGLGDYQPIIFDPYNPRRSNTQHHFAFALNSDQQTAFAAVNREINDNPEKPSIHDDQLISPAGSNIVFIPHDYRALIPVIDPMIAFYYATNPAAQDRSCFLKLIFADTKMLEQDDRKMNIDAPLYHFDDDGAEIEDLFARCNYMMRTHKTCQASDLMIVSDIEGTEFVHDNGSPHRTRAGDVFLFNGLTRHKTPHSIAPTSQAIRTTIRLKFGDQLLFEPIIEPAMVI
jgi:hypothetical protein